jgi:adenylate cyclase
LRATERKIAAIIAPMPREIERKFLLKNDAWRRDVRESRPMSQGYLSSSGRTSVRVRIAGPHAWLNIKAGGLVASRQEYEYSIPLDEARELLALASGPLVEKTRHFVEHGGMTFEIDEFHGENSGLVVAELELDREDAPFPRPAWLGVDVTELRRYYNVCLVEHPYCEWNDAERNP